MNIHINITISKELHEIYINEHNKFCLFPVPVYHKILINYHVMWLYFQFVHIIKFIDSMSVNQWWDINQ